MDCLLNHIGILGCNSVTPPSGVYINELPGISLKSIDKIADSEQATYLGVWDDVQKRTVRKFGTAITSYFGRKYEVKKLVDSLRFGTPLDITNPTPLSPDEWRGVTIVMNPFNPNADISKLLTQAFTEIEFNGYVKVAADIQFRVYDELNGVELWSDSISISPDTWTSITPFWSSSVHDISTRIRLEYNATKVDSYKTEIPEGGCCIDTCMDAKLIGHVLSAAGVITEHDDNAFGFRGYASLRCSLDGLVCGNRDLFTTGLWYMMGAEMLTERIYSDRINNYTTINREKAKELRAEFVTEYENEINRAAETIKLNPMDFCLECNSQVMDLPLRP